MEFELMLFLCLFVGSVALMASLLWVLDQTTLVPSDIPTRLDPITGRKDRIAIHDIDGPYISMPEVMRTRAEMVEWMTQELPKLMVNTSGSHGVVQESPLGRGGRSYRRKL
jgi:hypothetical protein